MDEKLTALKLLLDSLGVSAEIATFNDRKRVQKAVYLGQHSGVDLGYRFGWYVYGPYSPGLTRDYFQLAEALSTNPAAFEGKRLRHEDKLKELVPVFNVPSAVSTKLGQEQWLELLASYHYLRTVSMQNKEQAIELLKVRKPTLAPYVEHAHNALQDSSRLKV